MRAMSVNWCQWTTEAMKKKYLHEGDKRDLQREEELSGKLYEIELSTGVPISPMIRLRKQLEHRPFKTPFYINIMNEGVKLYF